MRKIKFEIVTGKNKDLMPKCSWGSSEENVVKAYSLDGKIYTTFPLTVEDKYLVEDAINEAFALGQEAKAEEIRKVLGVRER